MLRIAALCLAVSPFLAFELPAQSPAQAPASPVASQDPSFSLQVQSRLVVEDVTVLDSKGRPVTGLPASAFHVFDEGHPESIRNFRELHGVAAPEPESAAATKEPGEGAFVSNAKLFGNQGTVVALLIDPATMSLEEQMFLRIQALKFIDQAPPETSMAVFRVNSFGVPVLLQSITHDHGQLRAAIEASVPTFTRPSSNAFLDAVTELGNIADYLRAVPGRKAVIWLAGRFPLYQPPDYGGLCNSGADSCGAYSNATHLDLLHDAFRALQEARIAVYPVDTRGVMMGGLSFVPVKATGPNGSSDEVDVGSKPTSETESVTGQYDEMDRLADATGGHAFYSNNNVSGILQQALQLTAEGYALTYRPDQGAADGKWHKVVVRVDGPYKVQYRQGYFAAKAAVPTTPGSPASRRVLTADNSAPSPAPVAAPPATATAQAPGPVSPAAASTRPNAAVPSAAATGPKVADSRPLLFSAHLLAEHDGSKGGKVAIRYVIPTDQLLFDGSADGHAHFRLAALAYDTNGDVLSHAMDVVDTHYSADQKQLAARIGTPADQTVEVAKDAKYLLLAVEDLRTGKVGTVQLPLRQVPTI